MAQTPTKVVRCALLLLKVQKLILYHIYHGVFFVKICETIYHYINNCMDNEPWLVWKFDITCILILISCFLQNFKRIERKFEVIVLVIAQSNLLCRHNVPKFLYQPQNRPWYCISNLIMCLWLCVIYILHCRYCTIVFCTLFRGGQ